MSSSLRACFAEAIGTFVLVFFGCGSVVFAAKDIGVVGISAAFGLAVMVMIYAIGPISGCHINPAVTIALWITRRFKGNVIGYIVAQVIGGIVAAAILLVIARGHLITTHVPGGDDRVIPDGYDPVKTGFATTGYGFDRSPGHYSMAAGFVAEIIFTGMLIFTIFGVTDAKAPVGFAGIAIGLYVTLALLAGIPVTGCSMNPARSLGVAVFAGPAALAQLWMFIVAPITGGLIGAGIYEIIRDRIPAIAEKTAVRATTAQETDRYATDGASTGAGAR